MEMEVDGAEGCLGSFKALKSEHRRSEERRVGKECPV